MNWSWFIAALGLVFVVEGILPFLSPPSWRKYIQQLFLQNDHSLRVIGLISMLIGLALIFLAKEVNLLNNVDLPALV